MKTIVLFFFFFLSINTYAKELLKNGPMLGYNYYREVMIWLQTNEEAEVYIKYSPLDSKDSYLTDRILTKKDKAFTAHLIAEKCLPGTKYTYEIFINDEKINISFPLTFKTQSQRDNEGNYKDFRLMTGSCAFISEEYFDRPGEPYGQHYEIFESMSNMNADLMVWLGDNVYFREADWYSKSGMISRYENSRSIPEYKQLFAGCNHYAIWDDHDYGPNDSDRGYRDKNNALEIFKMFWANPAYGNEKANGVFFKFSYHDVDFFMLDNRFHRSPTKRRTGKRTILGDEQLNWLLENLSYSNATFKIIAMGGEFINTEQTHEFYSQFPEERQKILDHIINNNIEGVLFLNGDLHMSDLCVYNPKDYYPIYDFTVSPLTSGPYKAGCKKNDPMRIDGTCVSERNFGIIDVTGKKYDRQIRLAIYDKNAKLLWERNIKRYELQVKGK
jgi:alkaline phosphatase D